MAEVEKDHTATAEVAVQHHDSKAEVGDPKKTPTTVPSEPTDTLNREAEKLEKMNISFSIWPPKQTTRDAVINRLVETLSSPSVLSKRYGAIPRDEAGEIALRIEVEAFSAAAAAGGSVAGNASAGGDEDYGIEVLQVYSKEISKRMLDTVKSRSVAASASTPDVDGSSESPNQSSAKESGEEISPVDTES